MLLMAFSDMNTDCKHEAWYLDSGCNNHMVGNKDWLFELDESFRESVKLGNDSKMAVMGKCNVKLNIEGRIHVITDVYYLPGLSNNLLSIGQLQQKGITIIFKNNTCQLFHEEKGLIISTAMTTNKMYIINAPVITPNCLQMTKDEETDLWHKRYAHLSLKGLKVLTGKNMVKGLPELKDNEEKCSDCLSGKQHRDNIPKQTNWRASQKLELVHSDICGPLNPKSNGGNMYFITFTDDLTRKLGLALCKKNLLHLNCLMIGVVNSHLLCSMISVVLKNITPEEAWSGHKPSVKYFRIFGCMAHVHIPDAQRKKLNRKSIKCIHLGVSEESKAYKLYNPKEKKIIVSRDVVFEENKSWNWDKKGEASKIVDHISDSEDNNDLAADNEDVNHNEADIDNEDVNGNHESDMDLENTSDESLSPRQRRPPGYLSDYVTRTEELDNIDQMQNLAIAMFSISEDPKTYEEAAKLKVWREAMESEISSIESNDTWELTTLPQGEKAIGVKWIFKTKFNENGKIEKYKARLVAKGYSQKHGIDYGEVYAPVARWDTIRTILCLAAYEKWPVLQLDVKSAFLHGELMEDVYVMQPLGYQKGKSDEVYKLKKALYGLKQAPRAWYSKIESHFIAEKFEKCTHEHTLFVKQGSNHQKILIVSIYVDDLIYTGNDALMMDEFKASMKDKFAMTDLGKMKYFLGVEVSQGEQGIFIHQHKYSTEILKRFGMMDCNKVCSPIVTGCKLVKDENGKAADATTYKQMIGCLIYLLATRPDMTFAVCLAARYMERPTEMHVVVVKRIMRYLKGTMKFGMLYKCKNSTELTLQ
ncbi:putative LRR receptor-like protein kinase, partial [Trifolium pratense]